ncbi:BTAD domain-containing putative transcriptional regulator [Actinoplanes sichuanensis]|uniref:BTAD domain-containing putative transcriptional regulator n=1 Tax=Actinoplanes sichuanensis TaxID=512349 RepID=A0ABW4A7C0_9ACTN|nr:BTAD domain-containing putative transcriptional regulator [Actinoplanes sichuanensis]BEL03446.1 BTAD domain-containing putative transcriptional regulator [Actinoplanes sichuanensis]
MIRFGVLGPVIAEDGTGSAVPLKGPMHRAVLARLIVARRRTVPLDDLVADLWISPPEGAVVAVRTFIAALRRAIEPGRPARAPATLLVTQGRGYALRAAPDQVDAWRFEQAVTAADEARLAEALAWWRGPAYADFPDAAWPRADRSRLAELRLRAVERLASARLESGRAAEAVPDLDAHVTAHPWREDGWRLLALALYRAHRQGDALAVLRRARELLIGQLGVEPGPALRALEGDILRQEPHLDGAAASADAVWARAAAAYRQVRPEGRLESAVGLLRNLAVTGPGGLEVAREQRAAAVSAAEELGDPELTARVIGAYDVPAVWTRADDPVQSAGIVAAAERALAALPVDGFRPVRARLLATIAVESRGSRDPRPRDCARQAEAIARELDDPGLLAFALNGVFMQSCRQTGGSRLRDGIGAELVGLSRRHGLVTMEVLGHLIRLQSACAVVAFRDADQHARAADDLADRHGLPLVGVFTQWYRALRADVVEASPSAEDLYRAAAVRLEHSGMPGMSEGLLPLALLGLHLRRGTPDPGWDAYPPGTDLATVPDPPADLLAEALWCLYGRAAVAAGDRVAVSRARTALAPAAGEWAGAGSGLLTLGPVADHLASFPSL